MPAIAPRPVLLVAGGTMPEEPPVSRMYQRAGGDSVQVWVAPGAVHIGATPQAPRRVRAAGRSASSTGRSRSASG